jgi:hypothetical protein
LSFSAFECRNSTVRSRVFPLRHAVSIFRGKGGVFDSSQREGSGATCCMVFTNLGAGFQSVNTLTRDNDLPTGITRESDFRSLCNRSFLLRFLLPRFLAGFSAISLLIIIQTL